MANGTRQGAHGSTRRNGLPRIHSMQGVAERARTRRATAPSPSDISKVAGPKFADGMKAPGSMNPRKVGRG